MQVGPAQMEMIPVCRHEECRHPVYGEPVPCDLARREMVFCGFQGKYWTMKEEKEMPKATLVQLT